MVKEEARAGTEMEFTAYGVPLALAISFKYLGRVIVAEGEQLARGGPQPMARYTEVGVYDSYL